MKLTHSLFIQYFYSTGHTYWLSASSFCFQMLPMLPIFRVCSWQLPVCCSTKCPPIRIAKQAPLPQLINVSSVVRSVFVEKFEFLKFFKCCPVMVEQLGTAILGIRTLNMTPLSIMALSIFTQHNDHKHQYQYQTLLIKTLLITLINNTLFKMDFTLTYFTYKGLNLNSI